MYATKVGLFRAARFYAGPAMLAVVDAWQVSGLELKF
jgi:hypothetical protein